jgi:hypothetical protein
MTLIDKFSALVGYFLIRLDDSIYLQIPHPTQKGFFINQIRSLDNDVLLPVTTQDKRSISFMDSPCKLVEKFIHTERFEKNLETALVELPLGFMKKETTQPQTGCTKWEKAFMDGGWELSPCGEDDIHRCKERENRAEECPSVMNSIDFNKVVWFAHSSSIGVKSSYYLK